MWAIHYLGEISAPKFPDALAVQGGRYCRLTCLAWQASLQNQLCLRNGQDFLCRLKQKPTRTGLTTKGIQSANFLYSSFAGWVHRIELEENKPAALPDPSR